MGSTILYKPAGLAIAVQGLLLALQAYQIFSVHRMSGCPACNCESKNLEDNMKASFVSLSEQISSLKKVVSSAVTEVSQIKGDVISKVDSLQIPQPVVQ